MLMAVGNADHRGSDELNLRLSRQRALAVGRYLHRALPEACVLWRALGEKYATQPETGDDVIPPAQLAQERRVDVFYGKIDRFNFDEGSVVTAPSASQIAKDAERIVRARKSTHPNQSSRLLCYLKKLQLSPTSKNDHYWAMSDFEACQSYAYPGGKFSPQGLKRAAQELRKRARSGRSFLRTSVDMRQGDDAKFRALLDLDQTIYQSYAKVVQKLTFGNFGGERMFPYYAALKNTLLKMIADKETLYSCIEFKPTILPP